MPARLPKLIRWFLYGRKAKPVLYQCKHCGRRMNVRFKRGTIAPEGGVRCPRCKSRKTSRVLKITSG